MSRKTSLAKRFWQQKELWVLLVPCLLFYIIFHYVPMAGLVMAFQRRAPMGNFFAGEWVGFMHFQTFFNSPFLWRLIRNTFLLSFYSLIFGFPVPIIFAILLNEIQGKRFKKVVQTVSYLPFFISLVIVVGILRQMVAVDTGVVNRIIETFGGEQINFFMSREWFRTLFVGSSIWQFFGWESIIYLAAMSAIDTQLYEAATIDGANRFRRIWHVTLPGIAPTIIILLIMNLGNLLNIGHERVILMYNEATWETADVISTFVFRVGLHEGNHNFGAAVGLLNSIFALFFLSTSNFFSKKITGVGLW